MKSNYRFRRSHVVAILLVATLIVIGRVTVKDYGVSTDEYVQNLYAQQTIQSYLGQFDPNATIADLRFYGPFFSVLSLVGTRILVSLPLGLASFQAAHFTYFLSFVLGCISIYYLLLLFVRWPTAIAGTALFAFQPLVFGHAFINPKDTPMLGFFTAAMALGIYAVQELRDISWLSPRTADRLGQADPGSSHWVGRPPTKRSWLALGLVVGALIVSGIDLGKMHWSLSASIWGVSSAYEGNGPGLLNVLFHIIAQDAAKTPLDAYLAKLLVGYVCLASLWMAVLILGFVWAAARVFLRMGLPEVIRTHRGWVLLVVAAALLGMTISIRVGGLFAGALIALLLVWTKGTRGLIPLAVYGLVAVAVTVTTWPFLWRDTLSRGWASLQVMVNFPHETSVLYRGIAFNSTNLPPDYVAGLMLVQFTLPLFPLAGYGLIRAILRTRSRRQERRLVEILGIWCVVPVLAFVAVRPTLYGTIRQLLFVTPPLFVFAGLGIEGLWDWLPGPSLQGLLACALVAPGVVGIVRLHPYEYVYYNALVGGTQGAYQRYEMDYWCTSLREATMELNGLAGPGETAAVLFRDTSQVAPFARPDLRIVHVRTVNDVLVTRPDKVLACTPAFVFAHANDWPTVADVHRGAAVFAKVMQGPAK